MSDHIQEQPSGGIPDQLPPGWVVVGAYVRWSVARSAVEALEEVEVPCVVVPWPDGGEGAFQVAVAPEEAEFAADWLRREEAHFGEDAPEPDDRSLREEFADEAWSLALGGLLLPPMALFGVDAAVKAFRMPGTMRPAYRKRAWRGLVLGLLIGVPLVVLFVVCMGWPLVRWLEKW